METEQQQGRQKRRWNLSTKTIIALGIGVAGGMILRACGLSLIAETFISPFGTLFLNLIKMLVVPMVFFSIVTGTCGLGDARQVGRIGGKTILYFLCTTSIAATLGILAANLFHIGSGLHLTAAASVDAAEIPNFVDTLLNMVPANPVMALAEGNMLQIIVFAVMFGGGVILIGRKGTPVTEFCSAAADAMYALTGAVMKFTPYAVFALITPIVAENGPKVLLPLISVIGAVYGTCVVHAVCVYGMSVKLFAKKGFGEFFRAAAEPIVFAFSSASSSATLPYSMKAAERLGVSQPVRSFVLPLGSTINMDGTAIYQGICALFIAAVYGIHLGIGQQVMIVLTCTFASVGAAGVPGSAIVMLSMVLQSAGLPIEGIALVAGIDRITDMAPTATNITGDIACSAVVQATEGTAGRR